MSAIPESLHHYNAAWNEPAPAQVRGHLEKAVAAEVLFVDPANTTRGIDALEEMIVRARKERPSAQYLLSSGVDGHNRRFRYRWNVLIDGKVVMPGMDVTTVDESGAILQIDGFFGDFPALEA